jgi:hypothetical protein
MLAQHSQLARVPAVGLPYLDLGWVFADKMGARLRSTCACFSFLLKEMQTN